MKRVLVRVVGALLLAFGLLGIGMACVARDMQMSVPTLEAYPWTGVLRAMADFVTYGLILIGGAALAFGRRARALFALALLAALAKLAYDLGADLSTARGQTVLKGDYVCVGVTLFGLIVAWFAAAAQNQPQ